MCIINMWGWIHLSGGREEFFSKTWAESFSYQLIYINYIKDANAIALKKRQLLKHLKYDWVFAVIKPVFLGSTGVRVSFL